MKSLKYLIAASAFALTAGMAHAGEIAVIVKTTNSNFWQNVNKGAQAAMANQSGHTMSFDGPAAESDIAAEVNPRVDPNAQAPLQVLDEIEDR